MVKAIFRKVLSPSIKEYSVAKLIKMVRYLEDIKIVKILRDLLTRVTLIV